MRKDQSKAFHLDFRRKREKKMDFIPDKSEIQVDKIEPGKDQVLKQLIKDLGVKKLVPAMNKKTNKPQ